MSVLPSYRVMTIAKRKRKKIHVHEHQEHQEQQQDADNNARECEQHTRHK
jgi:hypothetical protein